MLDEYWKLFRWVSSTKQVGGLLEGGLGWDCGQWESVLGACVGGLLGGCWDRGEAFSNKTIT